MKICVINPGASTSTIDVYSGLVDALEANGHEVVKYNLDTRIARAGKFLNFQRNEANRAGKNIPKPNIADILYQAGCDAIPRILHHNPEWTIVVSGMYYPKYFLKLLENASLRVGGQLTKVAHKIVCCAYKAPRRGERANRFHAWGDQASPQRQLAGVTVRKRGTFWQRQVGKRLFESSRIHNFPLYPR